MTLTLRLGYVPLLDAAPLILAETMGFAEEEGLHLALEAAPGWAGLRDRLVQGQVDAAQMLAPVPVAMALGLMRGPVRLEALSVLNLNGNVIGVSTGLAARMRRDGHDFGFNDAMAAGRALAAQPGRLRIGVPFAFSMHAALVRYWLDALDVDPARLEVHTVPPPRMAEALAADEIDAFCVGEPWGSVAVDTGAGELLLPTVAIWASAPEKVLAVRQGWADTEPALAAPLLRALWRAARWLSVPQNRGIAAELLTAPGRLPVAPELIERALTGRMLISGSGQERRVARMIAFHDGAAGFPWRSQAAWIGAALARRHGLPVAPSATAAKAVFRSDLYRQHLRDVGAELPGASEKCEGALTDPTAVGSERGQLILPADRFFDARIFDPAAPER